MGGQSLRRSRHDARTTLANATARRYIPKPFLNRQTHAGKQGLLS